MAEMLTARLRPRSAKPPQTTRSARTKELALRIVTVRFEGNSLRRMAHHEIYRKLQENHEIRRVASSTLCSRRDSAPKNLGAVQKSTTKSTRKKSPLDIGILLIKGGIGVSEERLDQMNG